MSDLPSKTEQLRAMRETSTDPLMIPDELKVENRKPMSSEASDKLLAALRESAAIEKKKVDKKSAALAAEMDKTKKAKAVGRIAKMKAKKNGDTRKMPMSGKDAIKVIKAAGKTAKKPAKNASVGSKTKTAIVAGLLTRASGCTTKDILDATGWPAVSVPAMAKAASLKLKKVKNGSVTRYYGTV